MPLIQTKILHNLLEKMTLSGTQIIETSEFNQLLSGIERGIVHYQADETGFMQYLGPKFLRLLGYETKEDLCAVTDQSFYPLLYAEDKEQVRKKILSQCSDALQYRICTKDGSLKWIYQEQLYFPNPDGTSMVCAALVDITDSMKVVESESLLLSCIRHLNSNADFDMVMNQVLTSILRFYDGDRAYVFEFDWKNQTTTNTYEACAPGISAEIDNLKEVPLSHLDVWLRAFEHDENFFIIEDVDALANEPMRQKEYHDLYVQDIHSLIAVPIRHNQSLHGFLGVDNPKRNRRDSDFLINLTFFICNEMDKRHLNSTLLKLSCTDDLTGFSNRHAIHQYLDELEKQPVRSVGVIFADVNNLKYMNDNFGHEYGDKLLRQMADILRKHFSDHRLFRISGDEFVVICTDCPRHIFLNRTVQLQESLSIQNDKLAAIGFRWEYESSDMQKMIYQAEQSMYRSKEYYHNSTQKIKGEHSDLLLLFVRKMQEDQFLFYLQPQISAKTGALIGAEALVRQRDVATGCLLLPHAFLPVLEREHLISDLDFYIFDLVCRQMNQWKKDGHPMIPVSVNFSNITLAQKNFIDKFLTICQRYQILPDFLIIEISRSRFALEREALKKLILKLQNQGIKTRVKKLTMENDFPAMLALEGIQGVKLDVSLIQEMTEHYRTQVLAQALIQLCHQMGQTCMACGVETQEQAAMLRSMGCDSMQGYFFGRPMPPEAFADTYLKSEMSLRSVSHIFLNGESSPLKDSLPAALTNLDSSIFSLLSQTSSDLFLYLANLRTDFSRWSPSAVEYFGLPGEYIRDTAKVWSTYIHPDDRHIFLKNMQQIFDGESNLHNCEYRARNVRGEYVWVNCSGSVLRGADGAPELFVGMMKNLRNVSKYDLVTGLLSPYEFLRSFQDMLRAESSGVLLLFGIDHFKRINDLYGYQQGDQILRTIAQQIQLIPDCTFFRMDGDKIACVIPNGSRKDIDLIYDQVCKIIHQITLRPNIELHLSASCGAVLYPIHGSQVEILRSNAEYALDQAKKNYRGSLAVYSEDLHRKSMLSFRIHEALRKAISEQFQGFSLCYQPLIHTMTGEVYGAEALLRFSSPSLPPVSPADFIPVLEESGIINEVGTWVLRTALSQAAIWRRTKPDFHISVNASYVQMLNTDFRDIVLHELQYSKVPPETLILELTESCKITDSARLRKDFRFFEDHKIQVALDDFGTGYASIAMLRELTPSWIKIDHTFVASITENPLDRAIIEYILQLCKYAKIHVCIEGVENDSILKIVRQYHPDLMQGYYFSKPLPPAEFEKKYIQPL